MVNKEAKQKDGFGLPSTDVRKKDNALIEAARIKDKKAKFYAEFGPFKGPIEEVLVVEIEEPKGPTEEELKAEAEAIKAEKMIQERKAKEEQKAKEKAEALVEKKRLAVEKKAKEEVEKAIKKAELEAELKALDG